MAIKASQTIWHNGDYKLWDDAKVHVLAHGLHYGSSVFEGIRVYQTASGSAFFRLGDHLKRLSFSAKVYRIPVRWSEQQLAEVCSQLIVKNQLNSAYIRPIIYRGYGSLGLTPNQDVETEAAIAAMEWGAYLGDEGLQNGVDVCISSWQRVAPNTIPAGAKAGGNYLSSQLISMEAKRNGYAEGIGLSSNGLVSEGAGENLFLVRDSVIYTPSSAASILAGITRDSVMKLALDIGLEVIEQDIPREMLYAADELFFTGTAAEITPIRSVDRLSIGNGQCGPITEKIQQLFFGLFDGSTVDKWGWLDCVAQDEARLKSAIAV